MYIVLLVGKLGYERPWDNLWASTFVSQTEKLARVKALMGGLMMAQYGFNVQEKRALSSSHEVILSGICGGPMEVVLYLSIPTLMLSFWKKLCFLRGAGWRIFETYCDKKLDWFSGFLKNNQCVFVVLSRYTYYGLTELSNKSGRHSFASRICFHNLRFKALYTILTYITAAQTDHEMCGQSVQHYGLHHHFNSISAGIGSGFFHKRVNSPPTSAAVVHRQNSGVCLLTRKHLLNYMANEPCLLMFVFLHLQGSVSVWKLGRVTTTLVVHT